MNRDQRDFSFQPVRNSTPHHLTTDQIQFFNREGYVQPFDVFGPEEVETNRHYLNTLLEQAGPAANYGINCFQARLAGLWDLCTHPKILDYVEDLIGPHIICWASAFFCKMPKDMKQVPWHQDAAYWYLSPTRTVTVWLAIDDVDEENSAMRFMPRSHNKGFLKTRTPENPSVLHLETVGVDAMGKPVSNNLRAGQISMHADMLLHSSLPNLSERRRAGLTIRYCPPEVDIVDEKWKRKVEAIICRGRDPMQRWKHHDRPSSDILDLENGPHSVGSN